MREVKRKIKKGRSLAVGPVLAFLCALMLPAVAFAQVPEFSFSGSGWGHGVGMSQYGAMERADQGHSATQIIKAYYTGVEITSMSSPSVRVNLDNNHDPRSYWRIRPGKAGGTISIDGVTYEDAIYKFVSSGGKVTMTNSLGLRVAFNKSELKILPGTGAGSLLEVYDASGPFDNTKVRYRGSLTVSTSGSSVYLVNNLNMQQYLYGVVPREIGSGSSIGAAAYKAQAIVARSYAYGHIKAQGSVSLWCTTKHQVYGGHSRWLSNDDRARGDAYPHEDKYANAQVDSSNNLFITYKGAVINAYFSACNGDYTANSEDVWSSTLPYARSRKDAYCTLQHSSHTWMTSMTGLQVAQRLKDKGAVVPSGAGTSVWVDKLTPEYDEGGHWVKKLRISWSNGLETSIERGDNVRVKLGFKSAQFRVNRVVVDEVKRYEDGHSGIRKVGTWKRQVISGNSGGAIRVSKTFHGYFEAKFKGTGITWVGPKASTYGKARVYIDGVYKKTVSLRSSKTVRQQPLYTIDGLDAGEEHTIRVLITYYDSTSKTVGYVGLDALDVYNGALITPPTTYYGEADPLIYRTKVGWSQIRSSGYSDGTAIVNSTYAKYFYARFKGQGVVWYSRKSSSSGQAKVYLDGTYIKTINLESDTLSRGALVYRVTNLDPTKTHILKVTVTYKSGSRSKTGGVTLDKLAVYDGTLVK